MRLRTAAYCCSALCMRRCARGLCRASSPTRAQPNHDGGHGFFKSQGPPTFVDSTLTEVADLRDVLLESPLDSAVALLATEQAMFIGTKVGSAVLPHRTPRHQALDVFGARSMGACSL